MDLFGLRCFVEIVRAGGFTRAAEALGRTQPAVSAQVKRLEESLGGPLIDRSAPGLVLTDLGRQLLPRAEGLLEGIDDLEREMLAGDGQARGRVTIATGLSVIEGLLPAILGGFRARHPLVRITLLNRPGEGIYRALLDARADLGLGWLLGQRPRIQAEAIGEVRFYLARRKTRQARGQGRLEDLLAGPLLAFEKGIDLRNYAEGRLGPLEAFLELPSVEALLRYAERGFGTALVPLLSGVRQSPALEWLDLSDTVPPLALELYRREGAPGSAAQALLVEAIRQGRDTGD